MMTKQDGENMHEIQSKIITGGIRYTRSLGTLFPAIYLYEPFKGKLQDGFNHLELGIGDQFINSYQDVLGVLESSDLEIPDLRYLRNNPIFPWTKFENDKNTRVYLLEHAYYHYLHHSFWAHYEYLEGQSLLTDVNDKRYFKIQTQAMLMCYHSDQTEERMISIYEKTINKGIEIKSLQRFRFDLEFIVLLIHYGSYADIEDRLEELEQQKESISDLRTRIELVNVLALYHYKTGDLLSSLFHLNRALKLAEDHLHSSDVLYTYLLNNKRKINEKLGEEVQYES